MEMVLQPRGSGGGAAGASTTTCRPGAATAKPPAPRTTAKKEKEEEDEAAGYELRRGPWTVDEDLILVNYIAEHGEGRWNALARAAGLKRTGKSCRLRWLNYLRPDVKRGDFTADEQLLILDLHSRWGNRWSKIAQQLPGRTDNEIKNYWRTRVQKHARQLGCDVNSRRFKDAMTYLWMPRLAERAQHGQQPVHSSVFGAIAGNSSNDAATVANQSSSSPCLSALTATTPACLLATDENNNSYYHSPGASGGSCGMVPSSSSSDSSLTSTESMHEEKSLPNSGGDCWTTTTTMHGVDHDEFWSTAAPALQELMMNDSGCHHHHQFQEDLITGWVQGFSDGISSDAADYNSLWSLDDMIWRMQ